jgi:hypothetical protein
MRWQDRQNFVLLELSNLEEKPAPRHRTGKMKRKHEHGVFHQCRLSTWKRIAT